jgi:hypothetical protein
MASTYYSDAVSRSLEEKLGERVSVLDFGAVGDGVADDRPAFTKAINAVVARGGGAIFVPGSVEVGYRFASALEITSTVPVTLYGEGRSSKIFRDATIASGKGLFDLQNAKKFTLRDLLIDGAVSTSTGLLYSSFGGDPMHSSLTQDTSVWVHGGEDIEFDAVHIEHTGGYAILLDARAVNVSRVRVHGCLLRNNRPHTFGTTSGDVGYGSWTGGILCQNQATGGTTRVSDVTVEGCRFERNTGNCVWQHGYGFTAYHQRFKVDRNTFLDCGLDGILFGNVIGGSAIGNSFRRIGYVCSDDTSAGVPKWLVNLNATALDTSGEVRNVVYSDNDFISINGGCINGDGFAYGTISNNTMRVPRAGTLEYTEDSIASCGPGGVGANWCQGIVLGNSQDRDGGTAVQVVGNQMDNLGGTGVGLYSGRNSSAIANIIIAPAAPNQPPITLGGVGAGSSQNCTGNVVARNIITYSPASAAPCVSEDAAYRAFAGTDRNTVVGNYVQGNNNAFEFAKDSNSGSGTSEQFTTSATVSSISRHVIQREGSTSGSTSALKIYFQDGATAYAHLQLQGYYGVGLRSPLLNVSEAGSGGIVTTGNRTGSAFTDAMLTGKVGVDSFIAFRDTSYSSTEANLLGATYALFRWNSSLARWEQSVSVSAGSRVWTPFSAGASVAGANTQIQFNDGGSFGAAADLTFDKTAKVLTVTGATGTAGVVVASSYIQSAEGFYTASSSANAVQAPNGGFYGVGYYAQRNDGDDSYYLSRTAATVAEWGMRVMSDGTFAISDRTHSLLPLRVSFVTTAAAAVIYTTGYYQSDVGFLSTGASYQTVNVGSGGSYARSHRSLVYSQVGSSFGAPSATTGDSIGDGCLYYDTSTNKLRVRISGSFVDVAAGAASGVTSVNSLAGALSLLGTANQISVSSFGATITLSTPQNIHTGASPFFVTISASNSGAGITFQNSNGLFQVNGNGAVSAAGVLASTGASGGVNVTAQTAQNSIQTVGGFNAGSSGSGTGVYQVFGTTVINSSRQFVGTGVDVGNNGVSAGGYNVFGGYTGQTWTIAIPGGFTISGVGTFNNLIFRGGILVSAS